MKRSLALLIAVALSSASCSFFLVDRPNRTKVFPVCEPSKVAPWIDAAAAIYFIGATIIAVADGPNDGESTEDARSSQVAVGSLGALFGGAAYYGFAGNDACLTAKERWREKVRLAPKAPTPVLAGGIGQACYPNRTCNDDLICNGESVCTVSQMGAGGGRCFGNQTCLAGFYCEQVEMRCHPGSLGLEGHFCGPSQACVEGLTCAAGVCQSPAAECVTDAHCEAGHTCKLGQCETIKQPAAECADSSDPLCVPTTDVDATSTE